MTCVRCVDDDDGAAAAAMVKERAVAGEEANVVLAPFLPPFAACFQVTAYGTAVVAANNDFLGPRDRV